MQFWRPTFERLLFYAEYRLFPFSSFSLKFKKKYVCPCDFFRRMPLQPKKILILERLSASWIAGCNINGSAACRDYLWLYFLICYQPLFVRSFLPSVHKTPEIPTRFIFKDCQDFVWRLTASTYWTIFVYVWISRAGVSNLFVLKGSILNFKITKTEFKIDRPLPTPYVEVLQ